MNVSSWLKQTKNKPLFEDLLWSRPENKRNAGKLLIIGGSNHGFMAPASSYNLALQAGAGSLRVIMPESLRSSVSKYIDEPIFAPSNPSGSFSQEATSELLDHANWADLTLLAGDFGHNSETSILLESFADDYKDALCLSGDSIDSFMTSSEKVLSRPETLIVAEFSRLQKLLMKSGVSVALTSTMNLMQLVERLSELTHDKKVSIVTYHQDYFIAASSGQVSTTKSKPLNGWELKLAAYCSVWWLQNKERSFESLTTAIYEAVR